MTPEDLKRELTKARDALAWCERHFSATSAANAALHTNDTVYQSPLATVAHAARESLDRVLSQLLQSNVPTLDYRTPQGQFVALCSDLDRCQHGRHQGDACGPADACTGTSAGNPHLPPGAVIGYGLRGDRIVMPDRDHKHDPAAWRTTEEPTP